MLAPAFYALDKRHLPMLVSLLSIAVNFGLNWFFAFQLKIGHRGLALSTSIVAIINFLLLYIMMRRYTGRLETSALVATFLKLSVAGALLGLVCYGAHVLFFRQLFALRIWQKAIDLLITIPIAAIVFFGAAYALRVGEIQDLVILLRRRLGR